MEADDDEDFGDGRAVPVVPRPPAYTLSECHCQAGTRLRIGDAWAVLRSRNSDSFVASGAGHVADEG